LIFKSTLPLLPPIPLPPPPFLTRFLRTSHGRRVSLSSETGAHILCFGPSPTFLPPMTTLPSTPPLAASLFGESRHDERDLPFLGPFPFIVSSNPPSPVGTSEESDSLIFSFSYLSPRGVLFLLIPSGWHRKFETDPPLIHEVP